MVQQAATRGATAYLRSLKALLELVDARDRGGSLGGRSIEPGGLSCRVKNLDDCFILRNQLIDSQSGTPVVAV